MYDVKVGMLKDVLASAKNDALSDPNGELQKTCKIILQNGHLVDPKNNIDDVMDIPILLQICRRWMVRNLCSSSKCRSRLCIDVRPYDKYSNNSRCIRWYNRSTFSGIFGGYATRRLSPDYRECNFHGYNHHYSIYNNKSFALVLKMLRPGQAKNTKYNNQALTY